VFLLLFCLGGAFISQKAFFRSQQLGTFVVLRERILWRCS